ncbi:hypothetical protein B0H14DRAFT_3503548 [Mycena olivaceomarginata]|nr:hypothetical protein B0H14DRAFT_3503548 [Mycena olivaceomarginata]
MSALAGPFATASSRSRAVVETVRTLNLIQSPCHCPLPIHAIRPSPPSRLPPRILAQDETLPLHRSQCVLKRTSTTSTTTLRDRGQLRVTLPSPPIDVVPGASPTLPRHPNAAPFRHPDGLTPPSPTHIGGTHHRIADSDF